MSNRLSRVVFHHADVHLIHGKSCVVCGIIDDIETEALAKLVFRPVEPDEPNTEFEVGYSRDIRKIFAIVYQNREAVLTQMPFVLFRYVNGLYLKEGQAEFEFAEIAEFLTGDQFKMSPTAIVGSVRRIALALSKICSPYSLTYRCEKIYVG